MTAFENLAREHEVEGSSNRTFGLVIAGAFLVIVVRALIHRQPPPTWAIAFAIAFFVLALAAPVSLRPLNRLWTAFGALLQRFIAPIFVSAIFFLVITPIAALARLGSADPLTLKEDRRRTSYWHAREPGPAPESMKLQS